MKPEERASIIALPVLAYSPPSQSFDEWRKTIATQIRQAEAEAFDEGAKKQLIVSQSYLEVQRIKAWNEAIAGAIKVVEKEFREFMLRNRPTEIIAKLEFLRKPTRGKAC